jgi:hypothetical protein
MPVYNKNSTNIWEIRVKLSSHEYCIYIHINKTEQTQKEKTAPFAVLIITQE